MNRRTDIIRAISLFCCLVSIFGGFKWLGETWPQTNVLTKDMAMGFFGLSLILMAYALDGKEDK